jgi:prepilin-type N-terminal cleavage/methylation domain-containing protein
VTRHTILVPPKDDGFTLLELLAAIAVSAVGLFLFAGFFPAAMDAIQGDAAMRVLYWQLKLGRETAINERRTIELRFVPPNRVDLVRLEIPVGETVISSTALENRAEFRLFAGQPDTPDSFGRVQPVWFAGAARVMFTADGMFTDVTGNPVNGTVFLGTPERPLTSRAITIFGATAGIRPYRWNGTQWRR